MGMLDRLEARASPESPTTNLSNPAEWLFGGLGIQPSATGLSINEHRALGNTAVWRAVRILSETLASLPLPVYERLERGKRRAQEHPLYPILHDRANPEMTSFTFREAVAQHAVLWGNGYAEIERNGAGRPIALWPLLPDRTRAERRNMRKVYFTRVGSQEIALAADRVLHIPGMGFDGLRGYSPITIHREAVALGLAAQEFGARFFANAARPSGGLKTPNRLSPEAKQRLKVNFEQLNTGLTNAQRVVLLDEGMEFVPFTMPLEDAQFLESRRFQIAEFARMFGVPPHMLADLDRATFCLPADVQVYTETGPVSVRDVRPGTLVWSRGKHGLELAPTVAVAQTGYDRVLTVRTTNRTLRLTANHRVLVRRRVLSAATSRVGGVVTADGWARLSWATEWARAGELRIGDTLVSLSCLPEHGTTHAPTRPHVSIGFMEFCGLLLGDGWVSDAGVSIARSKNAPYISYYREVIRSEFKKRGGQPVVLQELERMTRFSSVTASRELRELGLCGSARTKQVPAWVFRLDEERRLAFIRGFLDADGTVDKKGRIAFHSVNQGMLSQIRHLCMGLGIPVTNMRNGRGTTKLPNGEGCEFDVWTFTCSNPGANRRIWSHDPRYQDRLLAGMPFNRKGRNYPRYGGHDFADDGYELGRINSITEGELLEPVYDLQVAGNESFIANGVLVHNSNIEHQGIEFVVHTMRPWLVRWEQVLNWDLFPESERGRFFAEFVVDGLLRGDAQARWNAHQTAFNVGAMSINDIRELENQNPVDGGDTHFVPLNMVPLAQARQEPTAPPEPPSPPPGNDQEAGRAMLRADVEARSIASRRRLQRAHEPMFEAAAARAVRREVEAGRRAARSAFGSRSVNAFRDWVEEFYGGHEDYVLRQLRPVLAAFGAVMVAEAAGEIGGEPDMTPQLEEFLNAYALAAARRHVSDSLAALRAILRDRPEEELPEVIEREFADWEQHRPQRSAALETVKAGSAIAREVWVLGGATSIIWRANADACPICQEMDGATVGVSEAFVAPGESVNPQGDTAPLRATHVFRHPPLHVGCSCSISPGR